MHSTRRVRTPNLSQVARRRALFVERLAKVLLRAALGLRLVLNCVPTNRSNILELYDIFTSTICGQSVRELYVRTSARAGRRHIWEMSADKL